MVPGTMVQYPIAPTEINLIKFTGTGSHHSSLSDSGRTTDAPLNRKRRADSLPGNSSKRSRKDEESDSDSSSGTLNFDPSSLVKSKEGTTKVPKTIQKYLDRHLKHCLSKDEREALFREHPRPDLEVTIAPKVDKYISDFLGKKFP